jgi:hypothetical protein
MRSEGTGRSMILVLPRLSGLARHLPDKLLPRGPVRPSLTAADYDAAVARKDGFK